MNFFHRKGLGNHLLQLCPKVVKDPVLAQRLFNPYPANVENIVSS